MGGGGGASASGSAASAAATASGLRSLNSSNRAESSFFGSQGSHVMSSASSYPFHLIS